MSPFQLTPMHLLLHPILTKMSLTSMASVYTAIYGTNIWIGWIVDGGRDRFVRLHQADNNGCSGGTAPTTMVDVLAVNTDLMAMAECGETVTMGQ